MCAKYYELRYMFQKSHLDKFGAFASSKFALFSVSGSKDEKLTKSKPTRTLKHAMMQALFQSLLNISAKCHQNRFL